MQVPEIHLFSRVRPLSSVSSAKLKTHLQQQPISYTHLLEKKKYSLNPYETISSEKLDNYRMEDIIQMNLERLGNYNKLVELQTKLNHTYGYTFSHSKGRLVNTASYRSGNPQYPCLNHDLQPYRTLSTQENFRTTQNKQRSRISAEKPTSYQVKEYNIKGQTFCHEYDDVIVEKTPQHHRYRDTQILESLSNKKVSVNESDSSEFQRNLRRLRKQAKLCQEKIEKYCTIEEGSTLESIQHLIEIKNENMGDGIRYLGEIGNIIEKAQQGRFSEKEKTKGYFD